jgi:hypothetical protein
MVLRRLLVPALRLLILRLRELHAAAHAILRVVIVLEPTIVAPQ